MNSGTLKHHWRATLLGLFPSQLIVQMTDKCNATCPQCSMRISSDFSRHTLKKSEMFRILDAAGAQKINALSLTGGEPLLMLDDLCEYMMYAGQKGIRFIRTGTNGFVFSNPGSKKFTSKLQTLAEKLSRTPVRNFWISLDSHDPEIHESMRGFNGVVDGIAKAIPIFHDRGLFPSVNLGINRNIGGQQTCDLWPMDFNRESDYEAAVYTAYCDAFSRFYDLAVDLGFTIANACYPMSIDSKKTGLETVYQASTCDDIVRYTPNEKIMIFKALKDTLKKYRHRIRIFSPTSSLDALIHYYKGEKGFSSPCQGGTNYFFIDSKTGHTFPCGFRGQENLGRFHEMKSRKITSLPDCKKCDWECFRDPSELSAPILDAMTTPFELAQKVFKHTAHFKLWKDDLLYYRACDYFDGRKKPNYKKMKAFAA